uniref:ANK_REP_REGION domain-containing protein n=1 Tax=Macrostomum lignano TaxID=282301 RepID=A0A1I8ILP5_9PLAT
MGDDEADQQASTTETFNLDVFSKEFTDSRVYRSIVQGNLAGLYHAVYCLREPVTVIDTNFGVNYIHLVVTTASRETQFTYAPFVYALSNFRVDICQEDVGGDTPLKLAIRRGLVELVRAVLRCGAPPPDPADSEMQPSLAEELKNEESATNATAVKTVCEDFQPGLWAAVAAADYFLVDRLVSSWCRVRIAKQGESLISFARRLETGSLIVDLLESSRPTLEFVHATLAGDRRKMLELLDNKNVNADTFDRSYRPNAGAPCQPRGQPPRYSYTMEHQSGRSLLRADVLSRLPLPERPAKAPTPADVMLVMHTLNEGPVTAGDIRALTRTDPILSKVLQFTKSGYWPERNYSRANQLSVQDGCLLWGTRVVIRGSLEDQVARFLLTYRVTPHATTGTPPCELLMGRRLRSLLDRVRPDVPARVAVQQAMQKQQHDVNAPDRRIEVGDAVVARDFADDGRWKPAVVTASSGAASFSCHFDDSREVQRHIDQVRRPPDAVPAGEAPEAEPVADPRSPTTPRMRAIWHCRGARPGSEVSLIDCVTSEPWQTVAIDVLKVPTSDRGNSYLLVAGLLPPGPRVLHPMASNRSNKPAVDDTVPPASAGAVDSSAIPPATIGDASARPVEPTLSGASEKTPATPAAKKRSTTSGAARRRLNKARRAKEGGSQTGARGQRPAAAEASQSGAVAEEGLEPTEAPAQDREADAAGRVDSPPEESSTDPRASYADAAKRQPAVVILGKDARLSPDQLKQVRSAVDGLLWKQTLKGTPLNIHSNATRDSCLLIWPSDADSGRRLLELLPEQSWDLNLAFCREDERPRTKRHRIWVPARSVVTSADELRKGLLAVNRELPAAGLVVHDTLKRTDGTGFTAILGLSDAWMRRYPHGSFINVGLWKLRIRSYEADPPRGSEQGGRDAEAAGAEAQASAQTAKANRPARQHGRAGKAERAAEGGGDRRPARSTKRRGLYQRAAEAVRTAKISQLRREVAGTPRRTSSSREGGDVPAGPNPSGQGRLETDPPAQAAGCSRALGQSEAEDPMDGGQRAANAAYCLPANRGPFAEEEPMDTGDPDPKPINTQHCVAASVNLMRTAEQQLPGLVFVQEPWMTKGKPNNVVDDLASSLGGAITTAFEAACPLKAYKGKKSAPWWNPELGALRRRARTLQRRALKTKDPSDREAYTRAIHEFKGQVRRAKTAKWRQYCEGLEGSRPVARVVKALTNDRFSKLSVVKRPDGSVTESSEETLELMLNSFFPKSPTQQGPPDHTVGYADDVTAICAGPSVDTIRDLLQGFLGRAERWADQCGLRLSESKTTAVMFTNKLLWTIKPLTLYGKNISMEKQVRCLGLTLDHRLNWTPHIQTKAKKALAVLAQIRRAVGTTWGLTPRKLWWIYTAIIRPSISYASLVWASGLSVKSNLDALYKIQGRACRMTMGAPPSTPFEGMNAFLCAPPLDIYIKGEAAKSTRRLLDAGVAFKKVRAFKKRSLIPHSDLCLKALEECGGLNILTDSIPATLLLSQRYKVTIQPRHEASDSWSDSEVHCYTDGSMRHGLSGFGACVFFKGEVVWSYSQHTGLNSSVFQSEVLAISSCAAELRRRQLSGRKFIFHSDSQAALRALCRSTASSRSVLDCNTQLNGLALGNQVELRWIPGHAGFLGNERADLLAKAGSAGALLGPGPGAPIPASVINSRVKRWADSEHLRRLNRRDLRAVSMALSGHGCFSRHRFLQGQVPEERCPFCRSGSENAEHFICHCPVFTRARLTHLGPNPVLSDVCRPESIPLLARYLRDTGRADFFPTVVKYLLVMQDQFSKFLTAVPMPDQTANTIADSLLGVPSVIHSDQGANFESELFQETLKALGIRKIRREMDWWERGNKSLLRLLRLFAETEFSCEEQLPLVVLERQFDIGTYSALLERRLARIREFVEENLQLVAAGQQQKAAHEKKAADLPQFPQGAEVLLNIEMQRSNRPVRWVNVNRLRRRFEAQPDSDQLRQQPVTHQVAPETRQTEQRHPARQRRPPDFF